MNYNTIIRHLFTSFQGLGVVRFSYKQLICLLAVALGYIPSLFSQESISNFRNLDLDSGLPSSEVYHVIQDRQGFIWFATDRGVVKYNGHTFQRFTSNNGLTDNVVFRFYERENGELWMSTSAGNLCYYYENKIHPYRFNKVLESKNASAQRYCNAFSIDNTGDLLYASRGGGSIHVSSSGEVTTINKIGPIGDVSISSIENSFIATINGEQKTLEEIDVWFENSKVCRMENNAVIRNEVQKINDSLLCFNGTSTLIVYDFRNHKIRDRIEFGARVTCLGVHPEGVYVGVEKRGLQIYGYSGITRKMNLEYEFKAPYSVTSALEDRDGGLWISTVERGVFYSPNKSVESYTKSNGLMQNYISGLSIWNEKLVINQDTVSQTLSTSEKLEKLELPRSNGFVSRENCNLFFGGYPVVNLCTKQIYPNWKYGGARFIDESDRRWVVMGKHAICDFNKSTGSVIAKARPQKGVVIECAVKADKGYWVGTTAGLYNYSDHKLSKIEGINDRLNTRIIDLKRSKKFGLIVGTRGNGVVLFKDKRMSQITKEDGLLSNEIVSIFEDSRENIWIATNRGLCRVNGTDLSEIDIYTKADGLISNEITDILEFKERLYVGTKKGLSVLDLTTLDTKKKTNLNLILSGVLLNGKFIDNPGNIDIYPHDENIEFRFFAIHYPDPNLVEYRYRLKGLFDEWRYTKNKSFSIDAFPEDGNYNVEIQARIAGSNQWSDLGSSLILIIHPTFYRTWSFWGILLSLLTLLIFIGFKLRVLVYNRHIQQELFNRLLARLGKRTYLVISVDKKEVRIDMSSILYIQSFKDYCEINTLKKKILYRSTLKSMEARLPKSQFVRVNRSYLVRKDKIDSMAKDHLMIVDDRIPIGKTYRKSILELKSQYSRLNK